VLAFDPAVLGGGDVVSDFARRFLAEWLDPALIPAGRRHASLSAEASLVLARLRAEVAPGRDWQPEPKSRGVARHLEWLEARDGAPRARLRPGIAEAIRRASADYLWLRDRYGIAFPEIDYAAVDGTALPEGMAALPHEGIVEIDAGYQRRLQAALGADAGRAR
jgi:hypothetical protein